MVGRRRRTNKGNIKEAVREKHATLSGERFPIFDRRSAMAALHLRGHGTTSGERKKIVKRAAAFAPQAAERAKKADEAAAKKK